MLHKLKSVRILLSIGLLLSIIITAYSAYYKIKYWGFNLTPKQKTAVWTVEAHVSFTPTGENIKVSIARPSPSKEFKVLNRCGHQSAIFGNKLIIVGGMNNNNYIGSSLLVINLDFSFNSQHKSFEEIMIKKLEGKDDFESQKKIMKIKDELKRAQLGVITNISLPPIK